MVVLVLTFIVLNGLNLVALLLQHCYGVFTRSSKRPAIHLYFEYICWKFAGSCNQISETPSFLRNFTKYCPFSKFSRKSAVRIIPPLVGLNYSVATFPYEALQMSENQRGTKWIRLGCWRK